MRKLVLISFIVFFSCSEKVIEKPEDLIPEPVMVDIYYDIAVLNAAKGTGMSILEEHNVLPDNYIFVKYDIDSTQLSNSNIYYTTKPVVYEGIFQQVNERLKKMKEEVDEELKRKTKDNMEKEGVKIPASRDEDPVRNRPKKE